MVGAEFRTESLPPRDRFECWCEMASDGLLCTELSSDHASDFRASARILEAADVHVSTLRFPSLRSRRLERHISRSDPESYQLALTMSGRYRLAHAGRETMLARGDFVLYDSSRPFDALAMSCGTDPCALAIIQFPRASLPAAANRADDLLGVALATQSPIGRLVSGCVSELAGALDRYEWTVASPLATGAVDLFAAMCIHGFDAHAQLPAETRRQVLVAQIGDFIDRHLADPGLSPGVVAAAHHISVRYLHKLFSSNELTVAERIRHRRLEHCHQDLADPRLRSRPIHAVAARWGLPDRAHFSRLFRATYGLSPSEYRRQSQQLLGLCTR